MITEGDTTAITCEAVGYPPPTIVWSRVNGTLSYTIPVNNSVSAPTGNGNVTSVSVKLTLTNANREDTGLYECSASNSVGSDNRNTSVTVQCELMVSFIFKQFYRLRTLLWLENISYDSPLQFCGVVRVHI